MSTPHFLTLNDLSPERLEGLLERAAEMKRAAPGRGNKTGRGQTERVLEGRTLGLVFEKASTRTRVGFETAMNQLGGGTVFLANADSQLGRDEPVEDTARVLSRMVDCLAIRTFDHGRLARFAEYSEVPVINALTDAFHPCQLLADMQTYRERRGDIRGRTVAWVGDGNNVCRSYINAAALFGFQLRIACPAGYEPEPELTERRGDRVRRGGQVRHGGRVSLGRDPAAAVAGADLVVTDVWASMGDEGEQARRRADFAPYQVDQALMAKAADDALFMHCLPAHRGEEVSAEVLEGPQSAVWDEAENRLHSQKALLELLIPRAG